jgi:serine/threonine-protein kinase HipA
MLAQLVFWMLAATDGHAKNYSIYHHRGGGFGLTPLYDVLSTWPVIGKRADQLNIHELKLAMARRLSSDCRKDLHRRYGHPFPKGCSSRRSLLLPAHRGPE